MKKDKFLVYFIEIILLIILVFALFMPNIINRTILAVFLCLYTLLTYVLIKKKGVLSIHKKEVTIVLIIFGLIYVSSSYFLGIFTGFYSSIIKFSFKTLIKYIIPTSLIIVSSEFIREKLIVQNKDNLNSIIMTVSMILIDVIVYTNIYVINTREMFSDVIGYFVFASISCNLLYNYISKRYGKKGIIYYRLITALYSYIIPVTPNIYIFFKSVFRIIYPYLMYLLIDYAFKKRSLAVEYINNKMKLINFGIITIVIVLIVMLISCKFRYGVMVIGSGSMSGTLEKGDVVFFENDKNQEIKVGDIILFDKEGTTLVHRVAKISKTNNEYRFYTKGDANMDMDEGYCKKGNIIGVVKKRIKYIGFPSIWLRDMFNPR